MDGRRSPFYHGIMLDHEGGNTMAETFATPRPQMRGAQAFSRDAYTATQGPVLSVRNIEKVFGSRDSITHALAGVSFDVERGEFVGIMGPSGSGKTTL